MSLVYSSKQRIAGFYYNERELMKQLGQNPNSLDENAYFYRYPYKLSQYTTAQLVKVFYDPYLLISQDIDNNQESIDLYSLLEGSPKKQTTILDNAISDYHFDVYINRTSGYYWLYVTEKNYQSYSSVRMKSYRTIPGGALDGDFQRATLNNMCSDKVVATSRIVVVLCRKFGKIMIYTRSEDRDSDLLFLGEFTSNAAINMGDKGMACVDLGL